MLKDKIYNLKPIDPSRVSLYGRHEIGLLDKPLISNLEFKNLLDKLIAKDFSTLDEMKQKYSFEATQKSLIEYYSV
jgi:hypothetical protein